MIDTLNEWRKAVVGVVMLVIPLLNHHGIVVPTWFTAEWVGSAFEWLSSALLWFTPVVVGLVPNKPPKPKPRPTIVGSPVPVGILTLLFAMLMLSGCGVTSGIERPKIDSIAKGIAVTASDLETAAQTTLRLCGTVEPGGPCAPGAPIKTSTKDSIAAQIQEGINALNTANAALAIGETFEADDQLSRAEALLAIAEAELANHEN